MLRGNRKGDVTVIDTESRASPLDLAYTRVRDAARTLRGAGAKTLYKKIDSTRKRLLHSNPDSGSNKTQSRAHGVVYGHEGTPPPHARNTGTAKKEERNSRGGRANAEGSGNDRHRLSRPAHTGGMSTKMYRVGIIGCGWVSTGHMNGYKATQATEVVAAADVDVERLEKFSAEWGVKSLYTDYVEMLRKERLDIISICTWPALHCEMTIEAAKRGAKAILCEKPMTLSLVDANKMIAACNRVRCKLVVNHQRRFESRYVKAKELLDNGEIGRLVKIEVHQGDLFTDDHGIDLLRFYARDIPVRWVIGQVDWQNRRYCRWGHKVEDSAVGFIKFENGIEGYVLAGRIGLEGHRGYSMALTGTEGRIEISGGNYPAKSFIRVMNSTTPGWRTFEVEDELLGVPRKEVSGRSTLEYYWIKAWQLQVEAMIEFIENDREHICSGRQAIKALEIIAALYESSRLRTVVHFPLSSEVDQPLELMEKAHSTQFGEDNEEATS